MFSYDQTRHLFSQLTSQNPSDLSSDEHFLDNDLFTDQYSTPPTPKILFHLHSSPRQDPLFVHLATHKLNSITQTSDDCRPKGFHPLESTNLEIKLKYVFYFIT